MEKLHFHLPDQQDFASGLEAWVAANSRTVFGFAVYDRATNYYENARVRITGQQPGLFEGSAEGSRRYTLQLRISGSEVRGFCSCPHEAACKHLAAFLWTIDDLPNDQLNRVAEPNGETGLRSYLQSLDKEALIDLVDQFAPKYYRDTVRLQQTDTSEVREEFNALWRELEDFLLKNHFHPDEFEEALKVKLERLRAYFTLEADGLLELIIHLLAETDRKQMDGELYDSYSDGPYFGLGVQDFIVAFILAQPDGGRGKYYRELLAAFARQEVMGYGNEITLCLLKTTSEESLGEELPALFLEPVIFAKLSEGEKLMVLERYESKRSAEQRLPLLLSQVKDNPKLGKLVVLAYLELSQPEAAIKWLNKTLGEPQTFGWSSTRQELHQMRAELAVKHEDSAAQLAWVTGLVRQFPTAANLDIALALLPHESKSLEAIVRKRAPTAFLNYLETNGPFRELEAFVASNYKRMNVESVLAPFFNRQPTLLPELASQVVVNALPEYLSEAKERNYAVVVRLLQLLKKVGPPEVFLREVDKIKAKYRRRSKLMGMMMLGGVG